jgi:2-methylcitrate dehydratase PrpD
MSIAGSLAERIATVRYDALPPEAVHWAKVAILDTIGCTLAGSTEPCARIVDRVATGGASGGACLIFGTDRSTGQLDAALINGTASHALDYDDVSNTMGGHPSAPILAALFALAQTQAVDGRAFIAAFVAGYETETRIARGVNFHHYEKGWHPTATLGVFGATAACSHLLGLPADRIAVALGMAASFASGIKANFGTMTKPLHVGHAARNGLLATLLAADGFTANPGAFEHKQGFLLVFNGAGNFDADAMLRDWGAPWDIVQPGVGIKQYPCCGSTHSALDAMLMLVREHDLTPAQVERVDSFTHPRRLAHTDRPDPNSELDAKFSVQYCLARALTDRAIKLEHFIGDSFRDPAIRDACGQPRAFRCRGAGDADRRPRAGAAVAARGRPRLRRSAAGFVAGGKVPRLRLARVAAGNGTRAVGDAAGIGAGGGGCERGAGDGGLTEGR